MPLSPHEQRILDEIEQRLREEDPALAEAVSTSTLHGHVVRRIRLATVAFLVGFLSLMAFPVSIWVAAVGFCVMLAAVLVVYRSLAQLGREQVRALRDSGGFSLAAILARLARRGDDDRATGA
ncbi:MAG: DUF3040 domain-containing protein [Actinomycetota bacterium]